MRNEKSKKNSDTSRKASKRIRRRLIAGAAAGAMLLMQSGILPVRAAQTPDFSVLGAVGTLTAQQTQEAAAIIYKGLAAHADEVDFSGMTTKVAVSNDTFQDLLTVYATVIDGWDVGLLGYKRSANFGLASSRRSGTYVSGMTLTYIVDDADYDAEYARTAAAVDAIAETVDPSWSDVEKALYLHEYLAIHFDYDHDYDSYADDFETESCHSPYGLFLRGKGVCEAYTSLYGILLRKVGIESLPVLSLTLGHTWNLVNIGDSWYHVDVTWDDANDAHAGYIGHSYFMKSSAYMTAHSHEASDWEMITGAAVDEAAVASDLDEGFWCDTHSTITPYQGGWVAIEADESHKTTGWFRHYLYDAATGTASSTDIHSLDATWYVSGDPAHYYVGTYIVPSAVGEVLYYTAPQSIYAYVGGEVYWLYDLTDEQKAYGDIYGMYTEDGMMYIDISPSPTAASTRFSIPLTDLRPNVTDVETTTEMTTTTEATTTTTEATTSTTEATTTTTEATTTTTEATTSTTEATTSTTEATTSTTEATTSTTEATTTTTEATTESPTEPPAPVLEDGDFDGDGIIGVTDVIWLTRCLHGISPISAEQADRMDLYTDGSIDVFDLAMLKRIVVGR